VKFVIINFRIVLLRWPSIDQAVNRRPVTAETQVISRSVLVRFVVYKMAVAQDFFRVISGFPCQ